MMVLTLFYSDSCELFQPNGEITFKVWMYCSLVNDDMGIVYCFFIFFCCFFLTIFFSFAILRNAKIGSWEFFFFAFFFSFFFEFVHGVSVIFFTCIRCFACPKERNLKKKSNMRGICEQKNKKKIKIKWIALYCSENVSNHFNATAYIVLCMINASLPNVLGLGWQIFFKTHLWEASTASSRERAKSKDIGTYFQKYCHKTRVKALVTLWIYQLGL